MSRLMPRPWWRAMIATGDVASCFQVARLLQGYLDGELDEEAARRVRRHLKICRRCGLEAATYTEIKQALRRRGQPVPQVSLRRLRRFAEAVIERRPGEAVDDPGSPTS
jgi:anti-sigma factor RsiW